MPEAVEQERIGIDELIDSHKRRLHILRVMEAKQGDDTPPHVIDEIRRINETIRQLSSAADYPVSPELVIELGPVGRYQLWMSNLMRIEADMWKIGQDIKEFRKEIKDLYTYMQETRDRTSTQIDELKTLIITRLLPGVKQNAEPTDK